MNRPKVLIVDDDPQNLTILVDLFEHYHAHFEVYQALNGNQALRIAQSRVPDVIITDWEMPEMDGIELIRQLKASSKTAEIPVIMCTGVMTSSINLKTALEAGAVDYIRKPVDPIELEARVGTVLKLADSLRTIRKKNQELEAAHLQADRIFSAFAQALPGKILDRKYRLEEKIGAGGFGVVFRGTHLQLNRPIAVKIFKPYPGNDSPKAIERFRREGISATRLNHPNAIQILDSGISSDGILYLIMELLHGVSLRQALQETGKLSPIRCREIILPVCDVLAHVHELGMVHRDIKPDNVFLHQSPGGEVVKVLDFGIAKLLADETKGDLPHLTMTGSVVGTPAYTAPERIKAEKYDGRSDVFSAGVMLYEMLSGKSPFHGDISNFAEFLVSRLQKDPIPLHEQLPNVSPQIEQVVMRAISRKPADRPTAHEFAQVYSKVVAQYIEQVNSGTNVLNPAVLSSMETHAIQLPDTGEPAIPGTDLTPAAVNSAFHSNPTIGEPSIDMLPTVAHFRPAPTDPPGTAEREARKNEE